MRAWLRDPLGQFLLAGLLIFGLHSLRNPAPSTFVPNGLDAKAQRRWQDQQALLAEARRLGLDQNDSLIDRQLEQKMRRLITLRAQPAQVSDAELQTYLEQHAHRYREPDRYHAEQIWVRRRQVANAAQAQQWLNAAVPGDQARSLAASSAAPLQQETWPGWTFAQLRKRHGEAVAEALRAAAPAGDWSPVIQSGLGWHRLRLQRIEPGALPALQEIRARVEADWRAALAEQALQDWLAHQRDD